jgi:alpha-glucosidase
MTKQRMNGNPTELAIAKNALQHLARDHSRVPMQWDASQNAGFSTTKPWMRVNDDYTICNAKQQSLDDDSVLGYWKQMLNTRRAHTNLFVYGDFDLVNPQDENLFAFTKEWHGSKAYIVCNFSKKEQVFEIPDVKQAAELLVGTVHGAQTRVLQPFEGRVYLL